MPSKLGDPRWTAEWKRLRAALIAAATHCALCGGLLDKDAPPRTRWRPSVDHIYPVRLYPERALDPWNCQVTHAGCNTRRENTSRRGTGRAHGGRGSTRHGARSRPVRPDLPQW
jgi:5-methylcytosine-specific restriction endonuclease McrA